MCGDVHDLLRESAIVPVTVTLNEKQNKFDLGQYFNHLIYCKDNWGKPDFGTSDSIHTEISNFGVGQIHFSYKHHGLDSAKN